ncbi:hypothetical protein CsatB_017100 [Cannabis sativa]
MADFLDRADGFIKLAEAIQRADVEPRSGQPEAHSAGVSAQNPQYPSSLNLGGKRSNNNDRQGNGKKGKFAGKTEQTLRENPSKITAFSILTDDLETIYMATQSVVPYKKPAPMKKDISKQDMSKFCRFHGDYGHDTNECNNLKWEIEFLRRKNNPHVQKYVKADQNQRAAQADNDQDLLLPLPVDGHLQVIIGGPHIVGDSGKAQERYARTSQHEPKEVVLAVEERKLKMSQVGEPTITFTEENAVNVRFPHNDPLVMEIQIANKTVAQTMIDNGASTNILFKAPYEKMGLQRKDLIPCTQSVYGFSGQSVAPLGKIRLPLTVGQASRSITVMTQFLVIDVPSAFNVMLGRPALYDLKAVTLIFHSCIKFLTKNGVGCLRGNQQVVRECYNLALTKAKKEKSSGQSLDRGKSIAK